MIDLGTKGADAALLLTWSPSLADGDTLAAFTVTPVSPATVTVADEEDDGLAASFRVSGGAVGEIAYLALEATTTNGDTLTDVGRLVIINQALGEIITAGELRDELQQCPDSDQRLLDLIRDAREYVEAESGKVTIAREAVQVMDTWPAGADLGWWDGTEEGAIGGNAPNFIELNIGPAISITKIETLNEAAVATTWASSNYYLDSRSNPPRVILKAGSTWPIVGLPAAGILITYQAGYADPALVPGMFKRAVKQLACHWYENREPGTTDAFAKLPMMVQSLINRLKVTRL